MAVVAALNFGWFWVGMAVALSIGSVSLFADSVDFLEDTAINVLILLALGWSVRAQALVGHGLALVILVPAGAAAWQAWTKFGDPAPPAVVPLVLASLGAIVINGISAVLLARHRSGAGSLTKAAYLSARNDVLVNLAVIAMGVLTAITHSGWPDLVLGIAIIALCVAAAHEVWEAATDERLAARA